MTKFTVNTASRLFVAKAGVTSVDIKKELYSDAKEHWIDDTTANKFDFPIRVVAGDPTSSGFVEPFFFLGKGWKIRPDEANHTLLLIGNLELDTGETGDLVVPTTGGFTVLVRNVLSNKALLVGAGPIASAVWGAARSSYVAAGTFGESHRLLLGLLRMNTFQDNTSWNGNDLLSARLRVFATKAEADTATDGGVEPALATFQITAVYEAPGKPATFKLTRES